MDAFWHSHVVSGAEDRKNFFMTIDVGHKSISRPRHPNRSWYEALLAHPAHVAEKLDKYMLFLSESSYVDVFFIFYPFFVVILSEIASVMLGILQVIIKCL